MKIPDVPLTGRVRVLSKVPDNVIAHRSQKAVNEWQTALIWDEPENPDDGPSQALAEILHQTIIERFGAMKYRTGDVSDKTLRVISKYREWRLSGTLTWFIVAVDEFSCAQSIFDQGGWTMGDETVLLKCTDTRATDILASSNTSSWKLEGEEISISALTDGDGMLITASSSQYLEETVSTILSSMHNAGFKIDFQDVRF